MKNSVKVKNDKVEVVDLEVKTRGQAMDDGDILYFSGTPCQNGHNGLRYVRDNMCKICSQEKTAAYKLKRKEKLVEENKKEAELIRKIQRDALLAVIK
jgi:hypothetical protein